MTETRIAEAAFLAMPSPGRGYVTDYEFVCVVCGDSYVDAYQRRQLALYGAPATVCAAHLRLWRSSEEGLRAAAQEREARRARALARNGKPCETRECRGLAHPRGRWCEKCKAAGISEREWKSMPGNIARADEHRERLAQRPLRAALREERALAASRGPRYSGPPRRGYVYRLRDDEGRLLYVGKTVNVQKRLYDGPGSHAQTKPWFPEVTVADVAVFATEADALEAEAWAIDREAPLYNIAHPLRRKKRPPRPLARYSGEIA